MVCNLCRVSGRVQGVFFRASTQQQARLLNVSGYAKNCFDGSVEVLVCGEEDNVLRLCEWLGTGPEFARVEHVDCSEHAFMDMNGFSIKQD